MCSSDLTHLQMEGVGAEVDGGEGGVFLHGESLSEERVLIMTSVGIGLHGPVNPRGRRLMHPHQLPGRGPSGCFPRTGMGL